MQTLAAIQLYRGSHEN